MLLPVGKDRGPSAAVDVAARPYIVHTSKDSSRLLPFAANRNILEGTRITAAVIKNRMKTILPKEPKMDGGRKKVCIVVSGPVQFSSYIYKVMKQDDVLNTVELVRLD